MEEPKLSWGKAPDDLLERWPKNEDGTPEEPAFLTDTVEADSQTELIVNMLRAYDIPVIRRYAGDGALGKVVLGFSGYGVSLYVPRSLLADARELLRPVEDETPESENET